MKRHIMQSSVKIWIGLTILMTSPSILAAVGPNWIEQWGITWTFNKELTTETADSEHYQYGQFVDGSYYIVGSCVINKVEPALEQYEQIYGGVSYGMKYINGSMVNPQTNFRKAPDASDQAFDQRVPTWNASLGSTFPLTLSVNESLISVDSWKETDVGCPVWNTTLKALRPTIKSSAILTCLSSSPAEIAFRPAYCGTSKAIYLISSVDVSFLPSLAHTSNYSPWSSVNQYMDKPFAPDFQCGWTGVYLHPSDHMDYYYFPTEIQSVAVNLLLDDAGMRAHGYPAGWKNTLSYRMIQYGIDSYGIITNGGGWGWTGGGFGQGRKFPILFAGLALNDAGMKGIGTTYGVNANPSLNHREFLEDAQTFYISQTDIDQVPDLNRTNCTISAGTLNRIVQIQNLPWNVDDEGKALKSKPAGKNYDYWAVVDYGTTKSMSRIISVSGTYNEALNLRDNLTAGTGLSVKVHLFPQERLGFPEWGERHVNQPLNDYYSREYRFITGKSLLGIQLAVLAIDAVSAEDVKGLWNWKPFFDFHDIFGPEINSATENYKYSFINEMWQTYRGNYGAIWPNSGSQTNAVAVDGRENWLSLVDLLSYDLSGNPITFSPVVAGLPKRAAFNPATYTLSWQPWYDQAGTYEMTFSAANSGYIQKVTFNVEDVLLKNWYQDWINSTPTQSAMVEY